MQNRLLRGEPPEQLSPLSARRLAAATRRINKARQVGPKATVDAMRACLLSAVKTNPSSQELVDPLIDSVLATVRELYLDADRRWAGR